MFSAEIFEQNYSSVNFRLAEATKRSGGEGVPRLLAVSKKQSVKKIKALYALGQRDFGESYCQELVEKATVLSSEKYSELRWSYIGKLQSNKIKKIVSVCSEVQSLESLSHARSLDRAAKDLGKSPFQVYILVNAAEESTKSGVSLRALPSFYESLKELENLKVMGIMSVPPKIDLLVRSKAYYENLYKGLKEAAKHTGEGLLSLGMSSDLELAVASGSNCVRVGVCLFGPRD